MLATEERESGSLDQHVIKLKQLRLTDRKSLLLVFPYFELLYLCIELRQ